MAFTRIFGCELYWKEVGDGPPVVLLHGLGDCHRTWSKAAPLLARTHRVLMLDLPGHGLSGRPDASYALEWQAGVVGAWLASTGLSQVDVVGHSYGGGVAMTMTHLEQRARIRRLALVAPGGLGRDVSLALRLASIPFLVERFGQPFMARGTRLALSAFGGAYDETDLEAISSMNASTGSARAFARTVRDVIDWRGQHRHFADREAELRALPPIGLFWGDHDRVIPFAHATTAASLLDGASLTRFANCGHFPHRERTAQFVQALDRFLDAPIAERARLHARSRGEGEGLPTRGPASEVTLAQVA